MVCAVVRRMAGDTSQSDSSYEPVIIHTQGRLIELASLSGIADIRFGDCSAESSRAGIQKKGLFKEKLV